MKSGWILLAVGCGALGTMKADAQAWTQPRVAGSVPLGEANATGILMVTGGKNILGTASVITALDRPAHVTLDRGGSILVCQTSVLKLTESQMGPADALVRDWSPQVLLALDRGAMEVRMPMLPGDALVTPDLRFTSASSKGKGEALDLAIRTTSNGDTCVENRGKKAPTLNISDSFGESSYQLKAGQHVMFEHGSLKEVNDRESTPCGCPPVGHEEISLAEAAVRRGSSKPVTAKQAAKEHPFPAAVSEGLAPPSPLPPEDPKTTHVQVATTLSYDPAADQKPAPAATGTVPPEVTLATAPALNPPPPPKVEGHGVMHSIGSFFKRIFVR
ncbi:hypothetical protein [Granulicella tundricola]|uniref:FecR protein domain-containing protein n=1 Tax=Granulicella tundricola (strain ATCC BAA-1859 / DSM 23138 / MP5ACTX9) TaxID=1198114 RepID=E8X080_GRATM|nr:hypothetical protein [Granulicella tundricola]ADW70061.1 hypothetical protein AciX9_3041 [Granulicella tundricola MP5ACTX9]